MTMLGDAWTVTRKELVEIFGDPLSRRGALVQSAILIFGLGVMVPESMAPLWLAGSPDAIQLFLILPSIIAGGLAADAFAGERERRTLETLLATPLSDTSIVFGKAAAAILASFTASLIALLVSITTVQIVARPHYLFIPAPEIWAGVLLAAFASASLTTTIAIVLSLRIPVARSVQQMVAVLFIVPILLLSMLSEHLGFVFSWPHIFELIAAGFILGIAGLYLAARSFHRDRLFVKR
jgi:ABC-2 type transport system permease protein